MMRKHIFLTILALLVIAPSMALAGIYGTLKGKVVDKDGKGLNGASVKVVGSGKGLAVKNKDGSFTLTGITAGSYDLKVTYTGLQPFTSKVTISADAETNVDVVLKSEKEVYSEGTTVYGDRSKKVDATAVGSKKSMNGEEMKQVARESLNQIIGLSAGVTNGSDGFGIRGHRGSDAQIRVDGLDVGNQFTGGFGSSGSSYFPMIGVLATEEVQVISGNFSAEYGEAQSGLVNTVAKTGNTERYEGYLRWRTDVSSLWGRQASGVKVSKSGTDLTVSNVGEGLKGMGPNQNKIELGFGGPLQLLPNSAFFISSTYDFREHGSGYDIRDPWGNSIVAIPDDRTWVKNLTARTRMQVASGIALYLGGSYGMTNFENNSWSWMYAKDIGTPSMKDGVVDLNGTPTANGIPEYIAKQNANNNTYSNGFVRINHTLNDETFYEFQISTNIQNEVSARRKGWSDPNFFTGFELYEPEDNYTVMKDGKLGLVAAGSRGNQILDLYEPLTEKRLSNDGYLQFDFNAKNPLTGYYEGGGNASGAQNPFGLTNMFMTHGSGGGIQYRLGSYLQFDGNFNTIIKHGDFNHTIKAGFEVRFFEQHRHMNANPYDGNPSYDIYTDKFGGNIYISDWEATNAAKLYSETSKPQKPRKYAVYLTDQIKYKGIIINPGLRFDLFDPNSNYRLYSNEAFTGISSDTGFAASSMKFQVSPRISITYPITNTSYFNIAYGVFFKTPQLQYLYDKYNTETIRQGDLVGDPNMNPQQTNMYNIVYKNQFTSDMSFSLEAYYDDSYNQLGVKQFKVVPTPYSQYSVPEYGSSRGLIFEFNKEPLDHFVLSLNYTMAYVEGTSSSPTSNANPGIDPYTKELIFPLATYALPNDIRHRVNGNLTFFWGQGEGPSIGGIQPLENLNISFTGVYRSGSPYTKTDAAGKALSEINSERQPDIWSLDMRISKQFMLKDFFGESAGRSILEFYADVNNVLNRKGYATVFTVSGSPDDDGISLYRKIGSFDQTAWYKTASYGNAETFDNRQYDSYGNRLYCASADYDKNGVVTQAEKYQSYMKYIETLMSNKQNYLFPISIYAGMMIRF